MIDQKPTNPKDAIGSGKLSMGLVPDVIVSQAALAFTEGALKYGRFNWRVAGVRSSIYHDAARRHLAKWWNGEDCDPKTRVPHLASVIACMGILLDAELCAKLNDDRPPAAPIGGSIDGADQAVAHLKEMFKEHTPKQFTIGYTSPLLTMTDDHADDGWIKWTGGGCPVKQDKDVEIKLRNGHSNDGSASEFRWENNDAPDDIVAYRVVKP